jgi:hypothetical protein
VFLGHHTYLLAIGDVARHTHDARGMYVAAERVPVLWRALWGAQGKNQHVGMWVKGRVHIWGMGMGYLRQCECAERDVWSVRVLSIPMQLWGRIRRVDASE